jgi:hypothetical protein
MGSILRNVIDGLVLIWCDRSRDLSVTTLSSAAVTSKTFLSTVDPRSSSAVIPYPTSPPAESKELSMFCIALLMVLDELVYLRVARCYSKSLLSLDILHE